MKNYDLIIVGTGSAMNIVEPMVEQNPKIKIAVVDKDEPGGICLTRGCIPSKILLYPAEVIRTVQKAGELGISATVTVDFAKVMGRMRSIIDGDINAIREGLSNSPNVDYYHSTAEFLSPYTMQAGGDDIKSKLIFLCTGSEPSIPSIEGLGKVKYHTSDTILRLTELPKSFAVIGGGYIAAEYGHFLATMGSKVTIVGRNPQFLPDEEPEIASVARRELEKHMKIMTNHEVTHVSEKKGVKTLTTKDRATGHVTTVAAQEILVACGRKPVTAILHPERAGIKTDEEGWISVNEYMETSQPGVWALGDAVGKYLFKHVANYESQVVYFNAVLSRGVKVDYHAVPHAVFTYPEVASVGLGEKEATEKYGAEKLLIGLYKYEDTAKGEAMNAKDYCVKVIVEDETQKILGAHIVGPQASILIQEIINVMYTQQQSAATISRAMHIHPALSEVVERVFLSLVPAAHYPQVLERAGLT